MAKSNKKTVNPIGAERIRKDEDKLLIEVQQHYQDWNEDNDKRRTRKHGWNDITDAYYGRIPLGSATEAWPFISKVTDPRIRTSILEKTGRLINSKLRGRLVPREGGDVLGARINNAVLDFQWDNAQEGGSMLTKLSISDQDTRLYASKFCLNKWKYEEDEDGKVIFEGNEMIPLDIRDCGIDPSATNIKNANWFQHRDWMRVEDLQKKGRGVFPGLPKLMEKLNSPDYKKIKSSRRKNEWLSRIKQLKGLEDRLGDDSAFPVLGVVTEYRKGKWITFSAEHNCMLRAIKNPYDHGKISINQLMYYPLQDDPHGESEVEPVIPLWKAIQATLCAYLDEVMLKMRPPLKIIEGEVRIETIIYGPEAQWLVDRPEAVTEMRSSGDAVKNFQVAYSALISAFNTAMGGMSQGTSGVDPFNPEKTATEVKASERQRNVRDQKNQNDLSEFIKDIMMMWMSNNRQFLFRGGKKEHVMKIIGREKFEYFQRAGLDGKEIPDGAMNIIQDIIHQQKGKLSDGDISNMIEAAEVPKFPVYENPNERDPEKIVYKSKMEISDQDDSADLTIVPEDLNGVFDYIADVKSMSSGAAEEMMAGRQKAMELLTTSQPVLQLLQQEGYKPKVKELLIAVFEDLGLRDAERFFESTPDQTVQAQGGQVGLPPQATGEMGGVQQNQPVGGLQGASQANVGAPGQQQMVRSGGV